LAAPLHNRCHHHPLAITIDSLITDAISDPVEGQQAAGDEFVAVFSAQRSCLS